LLKTGRTVRIRTGRTTTSLGTKIEASVGMVFEAVLVNFLLEVNRTGVKVQQPVVGTNIEVLISARSYNCTDLARFSRQQICGIVGCCK
jgi:hypothetical protein